MGTKENNTKATETANEFTWSLDNTSKIFPIDYSVHAIPSMNSVTNIVGIPGQFGKISFVIR